MQYWVCGRKFTVAVACGPDGKIVWAAPLVRKFIGQPFARLVKWSRRVQGETVIEESSVRQGG